MWNERRKRVAELFHSRFGAAPDWWARAPGRVDLMGSHTDYNLGYVLTLPLTRDTWIAARANGGNDVRLYSTNINEADCFWLDRLHEPGQHKWSSYIRGVAAMLAGEGLRLSGFDAVIDSTVPIGSGLSSSAALECASAVLLQAMGDLTMDAALTARLCQRAEHDFIGVRCGILDQLSSCLGQTDSALLLDCRDLSTRIVPIASGIRVVICDTRAPRQLTQAAYAERRWQCEEGAARLRITALRDIGPAEFEARAAELPPDVHNRCRFIVAENQRVLDAAEALSVGDRSTLRRLYAESFAGARDLFEICSPPMIAMMDAMLAAPGVIGARQAGAGFGGCMVALTETDRTEDFRAAVARSYQAATGISPEIYAVGAAPGAGLLL